MLIEEVTLDPVLPSNPVINTVKYWASMRDIFHIDRAKLSNQRGIESVTIHYQSDGDSHHGNDAVYTELATKKNSAQIYTGNYADESYTDNNGYKVPSFCLVGIWWLESNQGLNGEVAL